MNLALKSRDVVSLHCMQLIIITPDKNLPREIAILNELFMLGLQKLHLRKPSYAAAEYARYIEQIESKYHNRIVLCGHFELLSEFQLGGIHLNSLMRNDEASWQLIGKMAANTLSTSFHSWQEILDNDVFYSYVLISPVFDSISKHEYKAKIDLAGIRKVKKQFDEAGKRCPAIIGLGGVGLQQIKTLNEYGFDGGAMLGGIWQSADPLQVFKEAIEVVSAL